MKGYTETVNALIKARADINAKDMILGLTALMWATEKGHTETVNLLIKAGADINAKEMMSGWTALMYATAFGHTEKPLSITPATTPNFKVPPHSNASNN